MDTTGQGLRVLLLAAGCRLHERDARPLAAQARQLMARTAASLIVDAGAGVAVKVALLSCTAAPVLAELDRTGAPDGGEPGVKLVVEAEHNRCDLANPAAASDCGGHVTRRRARCAGPVG